MEGAEPKLPGAFAGVQVMTPQQFVAKSAMGEEPKPEQDVNEAGDLLGAQTRPFGGQEFQDYMGRIANREKGKTDKYKLPYIHRSSVIKYYNEEGQRYDESKIVEALKQLVESCKKCPEEIDQICKHNQARFFDQQRHTTNLADFGKTILNIINGKYM